MGDNKSSPLPGKVPRPPIPQPHSMEPDETTDLEELEQFAKTFKQRRIKLGEFMQIIVMIKLLTSVLSILET